MSEASATVELSRTEVLALGNLLQHAQRVPLDVRGPGEIFVGLPAAFERLREQMTS